MKKIKYLYERVLFLFLFLLLSQTVSFAQGEIDILKKAMNQYWDLENYSMEIVAYGYLKSQNDKKIKLSEGTTMKRGNKLITKSSDNDLLIDGKEMLIVDHQEQTIALGRWTGELSNQNLDRRHSIDSLEAMGGRIVFLGEKNGDKTYQLEIPKGLIKTMEIVLDTNNHYKKITQYFRPLEKMVSGYSKTEIIYKRTDFNPPPLIHFDFNQYLTKSKKKQKRKPTSAYAAYTYEVIDYNAIQKYRGD